MISVNLKSFVVTRKTFLLLWGILISHTHCFVTNEGEIFKYSISCVQRVVNEISSLNLTGIIKTVNYLNTVLRGNIEPT